MRFRWWARLAAMLLVLGITGADEARAQEDRVALEGTVGWAGFVDDATKHHAVYGAGARFFITPRVSVGPELAYMVGPDADRDLFVLGSVWLDLLPPAAESPVAPYVVFGAGYMGHRDERGRGPYYWSTRGLVHGRRRGPGAGRRSRLRRRRRPDRLGAAPARHRTRGRHLAAALTVGRAARRPAAIRWGILSRQ